MQDCSYYKVVYVIMLHTGAESRYGSESSELWLAAMALLEYGTAAIC